MLRFELSDSVATQRIKERGGDCDSTATRLLRYRYAVAGLYNYALRSFMKNLLRRHTQTVCVWRP